MNGLYCILGLLPQYPFVPSSESGKRQTLRQTHTITLINRLLGDIQNICIVKAVALVIGVIKYESKHLHHKVSNFQTLSFWIWV